MAKINITKPKLNGSATLLAKAIQGIFEETAAAFTKNMDARDAVLTKNMDARDARMEKKIEQEGKITRANVQSQIAELRKETLKDRVKHA